MVSFFEGQERYFVLGSVCISVIIVSSLQRARTSWRTFCQNFLTLACGRLILGSEDRLKSVTRMSTSKELVSDKIYDTDKIYMTQNEKNGD